MRGTVYFRRPGVCATTRPIDNRPQVSNLPHICILLIGALGGNAQQIGQNSATKDAATFKVSTQLVVETVVVKDKSGNAVEGLSAKDFTIAENGVTQTIKFFEFQKLPHTQISSEAPGNTRYRDRRLMALYFDMTAMPPPDQLRALTAAQKFVTTQMTSADRMAIMTFSGGAVQVLQDFTGDRVRLLTIIRTM